MDTVTVTPNLTMLCVNGWQVYVWREGRHLHRDRHRRAWLGRRHRRGGPRNRPTVHNARGSRDNAIKTALNHLTSAFIETMAAEVGKQSTLADQVAAAAVLVCAHRQRSDSVAPSGINESILVLLLRNIGDDLLNRSIGLWKPLVRAAQHSGEVGADVDPARASEWIVRMLLSFELLPPIGVNLDNPRAVRRFVADHIVAGLAGASRG